MGEGARERGGENKESSASVGVVSGVPRVHGFTLSQ